MPACQSQRLPSRTYRIRPGGTSGTCWTAGTGWTLAETGTAGSTATGGAGAFVATPTSGPHPTASTISRLPTSTASLGRSVGGASRVIDQVSTVLGLKYGPRSSLGASVGEPKRALSRT